MVLVSQIWSYPASSVVGPTLFAIPYEEVFFFFVQTYITATLYAVFSRPVVHAVLLPTKPSEGRLVRLAGVAVFGGIFALAWNKLAEGGEGTYLALIVAWVAPFLTLLWYASRKESVTFETTRLTPLRQVHRFEPYRRDALVCRLAVDICSDPLPLGMRRARAAAGHMGHREGHEAGLVVPRSRDRVRLV